MYDVDNFSDMEGLCLLYEDWQKSFRKGYCDESPDMDRFCVEEGISPSDFWEFYNAWTSVMGADGWGWMFWY